MSFISLRCRRIRLPITLIFRLRDAILCSLVVASSDGRGIGTVGVVGRSSSSFATVGGTTKMEGFPGGPRDKRGLILNRREVRRDAPAASAAVVGESLKSTKDDLRRAELLERSDGGPREVITGRRRDLLDRINKEPSAYD